MTDRPGMSVPAGLRLAYFVVMAAAGLAVGLVVVARPDWGRAFLPPAVWPFGVSLVFDIAFGLAGRASGPIGMADRVIGVVAAGLLVTAIQATAA
ncbi:MAG: hypothetical protein ABWY78_06510 [Microvirga sp.]